MKCVLCKQGDTRAGETTVTLQRGNTIVVLKAVPAEICENCGEYYLSADVTERVMACADVAARNGVEIEVMNYAA
jgi:YgiT-type zinc finger domain-containing protein